MKKKKVQRSPGERAVRAFGYILMLLAVIVALYPILWVVLSSFKTNKEILSSGLSLPAHFSLDGYKQALEMAPIFRFFGTSLFISVIATVLNGYQGRTDSCIYCAQHAGFPDDPALHFRVHSG